MDFGIMSFKDWLQKVRQFCWSNLSSKASHIMQLSLNWNWIKKLHSFLQFFLLLLTSSYFWWLEFNINKSMVSCELSSSYIQQHINYCHSILTPFQTFVIHTNTHTHFTHIVDNNFLCVCVFFCLPFSPSLLGFCFYYFH